jgi:hypothetical protein
VGPAVMAEAVHNGKGLPAGYGHAC